jgi:prepilin-type N-terminal cleavage/methylation domain-containing protein
VRSTRAGGVTLVEMMVALTVLAVGLLGILAVHTSAIAAARRAQRMTRAEAVAESRLEELGTLDVAAVESAAGREDVRFEGVLEVRVVHTVAPPLGAPDDLVLLTVDVSIGRAGDDPARASRKQLLWRGR